MDNISKQSKPAASDDSKKKAHSGPANGVAFCDDGLHLVTFGLQVSNLTNFRRQNIVSGNHFKPSLIFSVMVSRWPLV